MFFKLQQGLSFLIPELIPDSISRKKKAEIIRTAKKGSNTFYIIFL
jgi:hypothetical protein